MSNYESPEQKEQNIKEIMELLEKRRYEKKHPIITEFKKSKIYSCGQNAINKAKEFVKHLSNNKSR